MSASANLSSFTIFPKLPAEIRIKIWRFSPQPRTLEIIYVSEDGFRSRTYDPPALRTTQESRAATIKFYPKCFGSFFHPKMTRINFSLDTIYIDRALEDNIPHFFSTFGELEILSLQYLAFSALIMRRYSWIEDAAMENTRRAVKKLAGLKQLICVYDVRPFAKPSLVPYTELWYGETPMELFEYLPAILRHPWLNIAALPSPYYNAETHIEGACEFFGWDLEGPELKAVYGWRPIDMDHFFSPLEASTTSSL